MYPRRQILHNRSLTHVFFRCHNRQFLLKPDKIKNHLINLWARYKKKYDVRIFDFIIMDNHAHMLLRCESPELLGDFMRTVNSQLARFINEYFERDSQAIRERYKSPLISCERYALKVMDYIWLNRFHVNKQKPDVDPYCSASWRINKQVIEKFTEGDDKKKALLQRLLDPYTAMGIKPRANIAKWVRDKLNAALSATTPLKSNVFCHSHTIGDEEAVGFRRELLAAFRRGPPAA